MKKLSIPALALTLAAGSAMAQSNVTVYGVVDAGLSLERGGAAGTSVTNVSSGIGSGSRLGFKGKEDLGGGMTANFILESGITIDNGASGQGGLTFGRQAAVGVSGNFGAVSLGRQYSPYYKAVRDVADPFEAGFAGSALNIFAGNTRVDNMVEYQTPKAAGFSADLAYGAGEKTGSNAANRTLGASATYANGPLTVVLAQHLRENPTATAHTRNTLLTARYVLDNTALSISHSDNKDLAGVGSRDSMLGAKTTYGSEQFLANIIYHHDDSAQRNNARQLGLAWLHRLSVRTDVYAAYAHIANHNGAHYTVGNATDNGTTPTGINLGLRHIF